MLHNDHQRTDCAQLLKAEVAVRHYAEWTALWHAEAPPAETAPDLLQRLHLANFTLWHLEDQARDPRALDATVAGVKRSIDRTNQRRNDLVEQFDAGLLQALRSFDLPAQTAPLNSETPGLMLDRLSILALKIFHTHEQLERPDASQAHVDRNRQRLLVLRQQNDDLKDCLAQLWQGVCSGSRAYRQYSQLKMYNDPELNPVLYAARAAGTHGKA
ncbi:MAG: DUF4254 domain-containing protein [Janthinobacterium lividum]